MADILSIPGRALHQRVALRLRQRLVEGDIAPGAKLNERELCEQLQVSRTPLREAIRMLAAEGLVDLLPNRGAVATQLSVQDVADTFEVIAGLEAQSGELAAQRITEAQLAEIRALHYEMLAAHARRDLSVYYRLNAQIHNAINDAAGNAVLTRTYRTVNARLQALRFRSNFDERKWQHAVQEHDRMIELLAAHDAPGLRALMVQHLLHKRDAVMEQLRSNETPAPAEAAAAPRPRVVPAKRAGPAPPRTAAARQGNAVPPKARRSRSSPTGTGTAEAPAAVRPRRKAAP